MKTHDVNSLFGGQVDKIKDEHNFSVYVTTHKQKPGSVVRYKLFDCVEVYITDLFKAMI